MIGPQLHELGTAGGAQVRARGEQVSTTDLLSLDADVRLTHYRLQKLSERALDLETGEVTKLPSIKEAGTGAAIPDERKELREIVSKMNYLFSGNISEADFIGALTAWKGRLLASETLAEQAKTTAKSSPRWATSMRC